MQSPPPLPEMEWNVRWGGRWGGGISKDAETKARQSTGSHAMPEQWPFCSLPRRPNPETMRRDGLIHADTQRQMQFRVRGEWLTCFPPRLAGGEGECVCLPQGSRFIGSDLPCFPRSKWREARKSPPRKQSLGWKMQLTPFPLELPAHLWLPPLPLWWGPRPPGP